MLLIWLNEALGPQIRHTLWAKQTRELSLLKLVRHFQALADRWMRALLQSDGELRRFRARACATAERLVAKASRTRRTTAQILHESLSQEHDVVAFVAAVTA